MPQLHVERSIDRLRIMFQYLVGGGGGMANIKLLLQTIARRFPGDHLDVVCSESSSLVELGRLENVDVVPIHIGVGKELQRFIFNTKGIRDVVSNRKPEVLWSVNFGAYVKTGVPQVLSIHNAHQVYPWKTTRFHPAKPLHVAALRWFFRRSLYCSDAAIVQTDLMADYVKRIPGAPGIVRAIPKSVEGDADVDRTPLPSDLVARIRPQGANDSFVFLYSATGTPHKNHRTVFAAMELVRLRKCNIKLVVTLRPDEIIALGGERTRILISDGTIVPAGWVQKRHLRALYDICDACLMPSVLESLSSAHLEAMQWGLPQVSADLPFSRRLCGEASLYRPATDPGEWADAMELVEQDEGLRLQLVEAGILRMKCFPPSWSVVAESIREVLLEVVGNRAV